MCVMGSGFNLAMIKSPISSGAALSIIVFAQFACTSLWFAGNAILPELQSEFNLSDQSIGDLTSIVQLGFIIGTLFFAIFTLSDRFSPSKVFLICAILGASINFAITYLSSPIALFVCRGLVGFFLAGIYPVGMKIAADYHEKGLGKALGYLVGALVVGTASPHLIRIFTISLEWQSVIHTTSMLALIGGLCVFLFVPDGPFRKSSNKIDLSMCFTVFREKRFRGAAFGYFGHMWELYTLWAFVPLILNQYNLMHHESQLNIGLWSFVIIGIGGISCVLGGYISNKVGNAKVAFVALFISGLCCFFSIISFNLPPILFLSFLVIWGMAVVADSPQFSTLVAQSAPSEARGTALTIVNSIGFAITIVSLQVMNFLVFEFHPQYVYATLAVGPIVGLMALGKTKYYSVK